jgi:hypothetical protein
MKTTKLIYAVIFGLIMLSGLLPVQLSAADVPTPLPEKQWEAPVMPGGAIVKTEDTAVFISYDLPYEKVLEWYKGALANYKDGRYRDWKDQMYIEDQGGATWHSIGIFKGGGDKTTVKIVHDNWTWIFSTLLIRFVGVFVVLVLLWGLLNISSMVTRKIIAKAEAKAKAG